MKSVYSSFILWYGLLVLVNVSCDFVRDDELNQAIQRGDIESVHKKIDHGVDVNGRGMHAITPLMAAAKVGRLDICKLLVDHGADVNGHNDSGSVLMWAVESQNESLVRFILESGAENSWSNAVGDTAESLAQKKGLTNIIAILKTK
jgi:ankyrin repeat protein